MCDLKKCLFGNESNEETTLKVLRENLFPAAIELMNKNTLPREFSLYDNDCVPANQRNLTDVRTRMGVLLEYELAKAISVVLPNDFHNDLILTYVIANRFPDLAFRTPQGDIGIRFEIKAIQTIAEEKSANFDTLLKDIRKETDFVVVLLWEWKQHSSLPTKYPFIDAFYIFDAYTLARMRDIYWLNSTPASVGNGRQGFDLCYGINCRSGDYNKEEGNYGKLMRIFDQKFEIYLPESIKISSTLKAYYKFCDTTIYLGLQRIITEIAQVFIEGNGRGSFSVLSQTLPVIVVCQCDNSKLLIVGNNNMPQKADCLKIMKPLKVSNIMCMNGKFDWRMRDALWQETARGQKPQQAKEQIKNITKLK